MYKLLNFVTEEMTKDYLKPYLKQKGISNVSKSKGELIENLYELVETALISEDELLEFAIRTYCYGNNRVFLNSAIEFPSTSLLLELPSLKRLLTSKEYENSDFNLLKEINYDTRQKEPRIIYQKIHHYDNKVSKIELCLFSTVNVEKKVEGDDTPIISLLRIFDWVTIDLVNKIYTIHTRNNGYNALNESSTLKGLHKATSNFITEIFPFEIVESIHQKNTLYNIYNEITEASEKPFREKVNKEIGMFNDFYNDVCEKLDYNHDRDNIKLLDRIIRLVERGLIEQEFELYSKYFEGKLGIVQRIVFFDGTGANVSAKVHDKRDNISKYEIYFDTKDTLDKKQVLDKLWVTWYIKFPGSESKIDCDVKFVVYDNFYLIHFIGPYLKKEVYDYVVSRFKQFEN